MLDRSPTQVREGTAVDRHSSWTPPVAAICLFAAVGIAYFFAARLSLALLTKPDGVAVFWPAAGIASGTLLALGSRARLPVTLGVVAASTLASLLGDRSIAAAVIFALCNGGEALLVAWLIQYRFGNDFRLESVRSLFGFFAAAGIGPAISGSVATVGYILFYHSGAPVLTTWLNWFASDALGIIMVAPMLIGLAGLRGDFPERWELGVGILTLATLAIVSAVAFGSPAPYWYTALPLAVLLPLLLAAYCRPVFAAAAAVILGFAVVWTTTFGIGDFGEPQSIHDRALEGRATLLAIAVGTLLLAALFAERRHNEVALKDSHDRLADGLAAGQVMAFEWDAATGQSRRSDNARLILGDRVGELVRGREFLRRVHPDDRATFKTHVGKVCPDNPGYALNFRFCGWDGREVWLEEAASGEFDTTGKLLRIKGLTRDITERKRAEHIALRLAAIVESSDDAIVSKDLNGIIVSWNQGAERLFGYSAQEIIGKPTSILIPPDRQEEEPTILDRIRRGNHIDHYETIRRRKDGTLADISLTISPVRDAVGVIIGASKIARDITERKRAQEALRKQEQAFRRLLEALPAAIHTTDTAGRITFCNKAAVDLWGVSPEIGKDKCSDLGRLYYPDGSLMPVDQCPTKACLTEGRALPGREALFERPDGKRISIIPYPAPLTDAGGAVVGVVSMKLDISERKRAERALAERNVQLSLAGKAALVGSFAYDVDTEIIQISAGYAAIHGFPDGTIEIKRSQWQAGVHPEDRVRVEELRSRAFRHRWDEYAADYRVVRTSGEVRWIESRSFVSYCNDGQPLRVVGVNIDATERKRAEEHQRTLLAELDHRVKNVLATVSAIITQTPKANSSLADFVTALDDRIKSLGRTHELLSHNRWQGVSLEEIVRCELAPYTAGNAAIGGPGVTLKAEAAQAVAMVLHELATNAAKYGAFSKRGGQLSLRWQWLRNGSHGRLAIEWQEFGGTPVLAPSQSGYGTSIVRELIPFELGGTVDLDFASDGLRCRLEIPADWLRRTGPASDDSRGLDAAQVDARDL